jgi:ketosteroid isomerase-like protein
MADRLKTLEELESIEAIRRLKHVYLSYLDQNYAPDKLAPLFTDDAVWTSEEFGHCEGRAAIRDFFAGISKVIVFAAHLGLNGIIDVEGDTAKGHWRLLMPCTMMQDGKAVAHWMLGDYRDTYVRRNGTWLFSRVEYFVNFLVRSTDTWAAVAKIREVTNGAGRTGTTR